jgi:hypothetical protein
LMPRKACAVATHVGLPIEFVYVDLARGLDVDKGFVDIEEQDVRIRSVPELSATTDTF